jgi:hypothetical protein
MRRPEESQQLLGYQDQGWPDFEQGHHPLKVYAIGISITPFIFYVSDVHGSK